MNIYNKISKKFKNYQIIKIESGASKKIFYRLTDGYKSFILKDFISDKKEFEDHLMVYKVLKNINISIPNIIEKNDKDFILIFEDFGDLRFDKIIDKYSIKDLLDFAVNTLIIIKKSIKFSNKIQIPKYNLDIFKTEILELPKYYFPYVNKNKLLLIDEFLYIWCSAFEDFKFNFTSFVHKDFNINNLILLPSKVKHLKCGVIDYQNAFWGDDSWDLFSLLEDSRIFFNDKYNEDYIKYFYLNTYQSISFKEFNLKFDFLNSSRQTRLLGRWVKLFKETNDASYLKYIQITKRRLKKSLNNFGNLKLINFYENNIFN